MAPKKQFSREQIIDTAFEIARVEGIDNITIRKIADKMGSSVAPIYVNFKDIEELKKAVVYKIIEVSQKMVKEQNTGNPFQDIAVASLRFAKEYSVLFRDLVMKNNEYMKDYDQDMGSNLVEQMKQDPDLQGFTDDELMGILFKMRIFQMGLSVMIANGFLPEHFTEKMELDILDSVATDVIIGTRMRKEDFSG